MWLLAACTPEVDVPPEPAAVPPLAVDGPVWTAAVLDVPAEVPARFTAMFATPPSLAVPTEPERYPPIGKVQDGLCAGDGPWRDQATAAVRATPEGERWRFWELFVQPGCAAEDWCDWLAREAAALPGEAGRPLWLGLATCPGPEVAALFEDAAPDGPYLEWVRLHPGPYRPRVGAIARQGLRGGTLLDAALWILRGTDGAQAERALLDLYRAAPDDLQVHVGTFLGERTDPLARRIHTRACAGNPSPVCVAPRGDELRAIERGERVVGSAEELLAQFPNHRAALVDALRRCATAPTVDAPLVGARCASALAHLDRAVAERAVSAADGSTPVQLELRTSLAIGESQLVRHLGELGFDGLAAAPGAITALEVLAAGGRAVRIDDGGSWPPRHERLLYRLARASGLDGVEFDEVVPWGDAPPIAGRFPRTALFAWVDGRRLRTLAEEPDQGWDVARAVGLVNAVLAKRGATDRVAVTDRWDLAVVGAPGALQALADQGLAHFATWDEPVVANDSDPPVE